MSRKSYVTLTLNLQVPIPQGKTQKATIEWVINKLSAADAFFGTFTHGIVCKLVGRHTTYL